MSRKVRDEKKLITFFAVLLAIVYVPSVAIMVYGGIKSVKIYTTNRNNITKKTNIAKIEKIDGFLSDVVPTKNTDGYFKPGDIVYYYDGTNVTQYILTYSAGTYTWTSQGTINL